MRPAIRAARAAGAWLAIAGLLAGCSTVPLERRALQGGELRPGTTFPPLPCAYRLGAVEDRRAGTTAGSLGAYAFSLEDAAGLVRQRLLDSRLFGDGDVPAVSIDVLQLYIATNQSTKIPVVVYRARIGEEAPVVFRSRAASVNWNATEAESQRGISRALDDVDAQLAHALHAHCRPGAAIPGTRR